MNVDELIHKLKITEEENKRLSGSLDELPKPKFTRSAKFNSKKYWNDRYVKGGNSGTGSYNELAKFKAHIINSFIEKIKYNQ